MASVEAFAVGRPILGRGGGPALVEVEAAQPGGPEAGEALRHSPPQQTAVLSAEGCSASAGANVYRVLPFRSCV